MKPDQTAAQVLVDIAKKKDFIYRIRMATDRNTGILVMLLIQLML